MATPTGPAAVQGVYFNEAEDKLKVFKGGAWADFQAGTRVFDRNFDLAYQGQLLRHDDWGKGYVIDAASANATVTFPDPASLKAGWQIGLLVEQVPKSFQHAKLAAPAGTNFIHKGASLPAPFYLLGMGERLLISRVGAKTYLVEVLDHALPDMSANNRTSLHYAYAPSSSWANLPVLNLLSDPAKLTSLAGNHYKVSVSGLYSIRFRGSFARTSNNYSSVFVRLIRGGTQYDNLSFVQYGTPNISLPAEFRSLVWLAQSSTIDLQHYTYGSAGVFHLLSELRVSLLQR